MRRVSLERYFPVSRAATLRKKICGIKKNYRESLYEYQERFKMISTSYSQHQISEQLLIQYFYEGLLSTYRNIIDAASGGALADKTTQEARNLISNMATNSQQFGTRQDMLVHQVNEVNTLSIEQQLSELTSTIHQLVAGNMQQKMVCGICTNTGHPINMCPMLQD